MGNSCFSFAPRRRQSRTGTPEAARASIGDDREAAARRARVAGRYGGDDMVLFRGGRTSHLTSWLAPRPRVWVAPAFSKLVQMERNRESLSIGETCRFHVPRPSSRRASRKSWFSRMEDGDRSNVLHTQPCQYERHRPEQSVLHRVVSAYWPSFRERVEELGSLPKFVVREVDEYLRCGLLEHGFIRIRCPGRAFTDETPTDTLGIECRQTLLPNFFTAESTSPQSGSIKRGTR